MKLSTRSRYGTRAMYELALKWQEGPIMLRSIAANQHISAKYLEQILTQLKRAGLVRVVRGARGGFLLAHAPEEITLRDILVALEGDLILVECVSSEAYCEYSETCVTREIWKDLSDAIAGVLTSITLAELVKRSKRTGTAKRRAGARTGAAKDRHPPRPRPRK